MYFNIMNYSYVSLLANDKYLNGSLVLNYSLQKTNPKYPFLLLISDKDVSDKTIKTVESHGIKYKIVKKLDNLFRFRRKNFFYSYTHTKLQIFDQTQFDKIVYLDSDMLVCKNIDELFNKQHMSAVPEISKFTKITDYIGSSHFIMNTGLMVIKPRKPLYNKICKLHDKTKDFSPTDQEVINRFFPNWKNRKKLHLNRIYNIYPGLITKAKELYEYDVIETPNITERELKSDKTIKIVHYVYEKKPWMDFKFPLNKLWVDFFSEMNSL